MTSQCDVKTNLHKFRRQLERRTFESEVSRRVWQDKAVVDVDEMATIVKQNVAVVTIFHLQRF